ncbi:unnamed protein product [Protopolystoma xenopodis]|uniref:ANK_REP_REGION domain-containing protein n=1 Tax=Protopolystoma xenopodis TaxID=117903 RepID=A0A3S5C898_9PLAT|nr:unnamed protein product [Protopolystoma xenopodis]
MPLDEVLVTCYYTYLASGADLGLCDFRGRHALHLAATCGQVSTLARVFDGIQLKLQLQLQQQHRYHQRMPRLPNESASPAFFPQSSACLVIDTPTSNITSLVGTAATISTSVSTMATFNGLLRSDFSPFTPVITTSKRDFPINHPTSSDVFSSNHQRHPGFPMSISHEEQLDCLHPLDARGFGPLHFASYAGHTACAEYLLSQPSYQFSRVSWIFFIFVCPIRHCMLGCPLDDIFYLCKICPNKSLSHLLKVI